MDDFAARRGCFVFIGAAVFTLVTLTGIEEATFVLGVIAALFFSVNLLELF